MEIFYAKGFGFLFDNAEGCGCDFIWFRLFINSVISLCSFFSHILFDNKLELVICKFGV